MTTLETPGPDAPSRPRQGVSGLLHDLTVGAVRDFVWADLRDGVIRVADLGRSTRTLVRLGLVLMIGMIIVLLGGDALRSAVPLLSTDAGPVGRGAQVPAALFPLTLFAMTVAWAFLLIGATRAHWAVRTAVMVLYAAMALQWVDAAGLAHTTAYAVSMYGLVATTVALVATSHRWPHRVGIQFGLLLVLVGASFLLPQARALQSYRATGIPGHITSVDLFVQNVQGLVLPLLLLVGIEIAAFLQRSAGWVISVTDQRLPRAALPALLGVIAVWRSWAVGSDVAGRLREGPASDVARSHLGAAGVVALAFTVWWLLSRWRRDRAVADVDEVWERAEGSTLPAALGYLAVPLALTLATVVALGVNGTLPLDAIDLRNRIAGAALSIGDLNAHITPIRIGLFALIAVAGVVLARRGRPATAVYLCTVAAVGVWYYATEPDAVVGWLYWDEFAHVNNLWTVLTLSVAVVWGLRGRLDDRRQRAVLAILLVTALLAPAALIEDPFSPFFASAGLAFIAFGIVWDLSTSGSWANEGSDRLPRASRVFLYLGYVIFSVTIISWAVVSHDLGTVTRLTDGAAAEGFSVFGRPLLYTTFVLLLTGTAAQARVRPPAAAPAAGATSANTDDTTTA